VTEGNRPLVQGFPTATGAYSVLHVYGTYRIALSRFLRTRPSPLSAFPRWMASRSGHTTVDRGILPGRGEILESGTGLS
jgi:hypothetical protein